MTIYAVLSADGTGLKRIYLSVAQLIAECKKLKKLDRKSLVYMFLEETGMKADREPLTVGDYLKHETDAPMQGQSGHDDTSVPSSGNAKARRNQVPSGQQGPVRKSHAKADPKRVYKKGPKS